jgi:quinone-modifying oxidoreductase subunit QmoB
MVNIAETMGSLGLEVERVAVKQVAINEYHKIPEIINGFVEEIIDLGPNPFKGF